MNLTGSMESRNELMGDGKGMRRDRPQRPSAGYTPPSSSRPRQKRAGLSAQISPAPPASQLTQKATGNAQQQTICAPFPLRPTSQSAAQNRRSAQSILTVRDTRRKRVATRGCPASHRAQDTSPSVTNSAPRRQPRSQGGSAHEPHSVACQRDGTAVDHPDFSHAMTVSTVAPGLAMMIGLGVGVDCAPFIVTSR